MKYSNLAVGWQPCEDEVMIPYDQDPGLVQDAFLEDDGSIMYITPEMTQYERLTGERSYITWWEDNGYELYEDYKHEKVLTFAEAFYKKNMTRKQVMQLQAVNDMTRNRILSFLYNHPYAYASDVLIKRDTGISDEGFERAVNILQRAKLVERIKIAINKPYAYRCTRAVLNYVNLI